MRYVALDPGGTTGWAYFDEEGWERNQFNRIAHHQALYDALMEANPGVLIVETFVYRKGLDDVNLMAREYIGVAKLWWQQNRTKSDIVMQTPAQAKNFITDKKLKALGLQVPGAPHANDATRHLLYYLV